MNSTTDNLSAEQVKQKILESKAQFVKVAWKSNPKPAAAFKGILLEKRTVGVVQAGINYSNLSAVKTAIENGERGEVEPLPWGEWKQFPYIIEHKGTEYIRLYPSSGNNHIPSSEYFANGKKVTKEQFATFLTKSESEKLMGERENNVPLCFTIKADNIIDIPQPIE